ncbi:MAG: serine hydrolase [Elusimicrobiota bacterium]
MSAALALLLLLPPASPPPADASAERRCPPADTGCAFGRWDASPLQDGLDEMVSSHRGKVSLYAKNMSTGETVEVAADAVVRSASTIKMGVFLEAFHQVKEGRAKLADRLTLREEDKVQGSGILAFLRAPLDLALEDILTLMMIDSDNTATNMAIDRVGLSAVNARFKALGLKETWLYKKVYKPAEGPLPPEQKTYGLGKTTAREMGRLLEGMVRCDLGDAALCDRMVSIMKNQQYRNMIPHYIEADMDTSETGSVVADKVGALDAQRSDVGIVFSPAGPIVIAAFTDGNADQRWACENEGELLIARLSKAVFDAWGRKK